MHHPMMMYKVTLHLQVLTSHVHLPKTTRKVTLHRKVLTSHARRLVALREAQGLAILHDLTVCVDKSPMSPRADSPSASNGTKSPTGSTHSHSPSKDVDESCVLTTPKPDSQGDSLNTTMTGLDGLTPMSVLRQVVSKVGSNLLKATVNKGRHTFGQLKKNIGEVFGQPRFKFTKTDGVTESSMESRCNGVPCYRARTSHDSFCRIPGKLAYCSLEV
jgi:hypothetical protein